MSNIAIIGSGSFGCALANSLANSNNVKIWSYKKEEQLEINNNHICPFIKEAKLNKNIKCYINYEDVIKESEYIFIVTPSSVIRKTFEEIKTYTSNQKIIICSKGIEKESNKLLTDIAKEILNNEIGILSGPSIAKEVIIGKPCMVSFASENNKFNDEIKSLFNKSNMKIELSNDIIATELGGTFKNIIALSSGIINELNFGKNLEAVLITKGLEEITKLGVELGAKKESFYNLSGLGDLIVTCSSDNSRNKTAGKLIVKGKNINDIKEEIGMVIEGIDALDVAVSLSKKYSIDLPIINTLYEIIYNKQDVNKIVDAILK